MMKRATTQTCSWHHTMIRIKDPSISVPFYENHFGFKFFHSLHFPEQKFSSYFLIIPRPGETLPEPETEASEAYLWSLKDVCLELTHNHGSESDKNFEVNNGNVEPYRGFGHIAVMTRDVYAATEELAADGVRFQKRPDECRMKGLAFALDPDGYWIEIVRRAETSPVTNKYTFAQTMQRIKDPSKSIPFYRDLLGMTLLAVSHHPDAKFSNYFLASLPPNTKVPTNPESEEASEFMRNCFEPVLELTHNHGTENDANFKYHNGNDDSEGQRLGFGHTGFIVDDINAVCDELETRGAEFRKKPNEGFMKDLLATIYDPDGYWVQILQRGGGKDFKTSPDAKLSAH